MDGIFLRKAQLEDINDVFDLSNKDYVRQYSINKNQIIWDDHVKWFGNVIRDNDYVFYIITDDCNTFLGQIRFKLANTSATVSISLTDKLKGKGISKKILDISIKKLFEEKSQVKEILADVRENNYASLKIFRGLNFRKIQEEDNVIKFVLRKDNNNAD